MILGKGLVMQREGVSTLYIRGTPREPFHLIVCLGLKRNRLIEEMREEGFLLYFWVRLSRKLSAYVPLMCSEGSDPA